MNTAEIQDVEAQELRVGDDLFGAGIVQRVVFTDDDQVEVKAAEDEFTFWRDEIVTVRRGE